MRRSEGRTRRRLHHATFVQQPHAQLTPAALPSQASSDAIPSPSSLLFHAAPRKCQPAVGTADANILVMPPPECCPRGHIALHLDNFLHMSDL
jgi:hypothetical protein